MTTTSIPRQHLQLADGRTIAYHTFGSPGGRPAFYCHGFPGTGSEAGIVHDLAVRHHVRLIAPDRPGFGGSSFHAEQSFTAWPRDVEAIADALGLHRFSILGMSGGAPFALACGWRLPNRVTRVGVVSGLGPVAGRGGIRGMMRFNRWGLRAARTAPGLLMVCRGVFHAVLSRYPEAVVSHLRSVSAPPDRAVLAESGFATTLARSFRESADGDSRALIQEAVLFAQPWGTWLRDVQVEVLLWHGELDVVVPPVLGRTVAGAVPHCRAEFHPDDGHFSLPIRRAEGILCALTGAPT